MNTTNYQSAIYASFAKKITVLALLMGGAVGVSAQNGTVTPYSRFGYGVLSDQANAAQHAMGGVGYAMRDNRDVNFMNPASYTSIDSLTLRFDMAGNVKSISTSDASAHGSHFTGGLDYITLQVPIKKWASCAAGLIPYSEVGYSFGNTITDGSYSREGSGGLNQLFLGFGANPYKGLSLGVNVSYLWGNITNDAAVYGNGSTSFYSRRMEVRDYNLRFGAQYHFAIGRHNEFTLGAVFSPKKSFRGETYGTVYDASHSSDADTVGYTRLKGKYDMPATYGGGLAYTWRKRLNAEIDFTYQPWKGAKYAPLEGFENSQGTSFNDRWKIAAGASYMPDQRGSWIQRVAYRAGGYYCRDYVKVGDNAVKEFGLSAGFGLPAPGSKSVVSLSFEYRHRQASPNPLVKENYYVVTLGITFNEFAFWRNKLR